MWAYHGRSQHSCVSDSPVEPQKEQELGGTPDTESEFWEAGSGQECFCILLKITKLCCADELACDFQLHYEETGHYVSSL